MVVDEKIMIEILPDEPTVCVTVEKGKQFTKKFMELDKLIKILKRSSYSECEYKFQVPESCISVQGTETEYGAWIYVGKQVRPVRYSDGKTEKSYLVPYPATVFHFVFNEENRLMRGECYAVKEKCLGDVTGKTELYQFPFSNVSSSGSICFGQNEFIGCGNLKEDIEKVKDLFYSAPYNGDYYMMDWTMLLKRDLPELFDYLNGKDDFLNEWLKPMNRTINL